jgi:type III secretory pathway lipoprotein EscJ
MRSRSARVALVIVLAIAAAACSKTLKIDELETELANQMNSQLQTTGITVDCPNDVKAEAGATFPCTASLPNGDTVAIEVTQKDDNGNVSWKVVDASASASPSP